MANIASEEFLVVMAAFSTAAQSVTETIKKLVPRLNEEQSGSWEGWRQLILHVISVIAGTLLFLSSNIDPFNFGVWDRQNVEWAHLITGGLLCSFGAKFFNDLLGVVRGFKEAKDTAVKAAKAQLPQ